jgi:mRNA interferase HigB
VKLSDSNPAFDLPVGFAGGIPETTTGLVRFGFRDYEPGTGRWAAKDPILFRGGQANLLTYAFSDSAREPTLAWYRHVLKADWSSPAEVKRDFANASILKDGRVVFNIAGNKYRIVVWINYPYRVVYVRFIGTHAQYDAIDVQTV